MKQQEMLAYLDMSIRTSQNPWTILLSFLTNSTNGKRIWMFVCSSSRERGGESKSLKRKKRKGEMKEGRKEERKKERKKEV